MQNNINRDIYLLDIKSNLPKKPNANVTENQIISLKHMSHSEGQSGNQTINQSESHSENQTINHSENHSESQTINQTINQTECQTEG